MRELPEIDEIDQELAQKTKKAIKDEILQDKDILDKGQNAFVSFVRYYKEHNLEFIFSFHSLNIGAVANAFFLFKIPRVKEILGKKITGFEMDQDVDIEAIPYKDANKGNQKAELKEKRKEKLERKLQAAEEAK